LIVVEAVVVIVVVIDVDIVHADVVVVVAVIDRRPVAIGRAKRRTIYRTIHIGRRIEGACPVIHSAVSPRWIVIVVAHRASHRDTGCESNKSNGDRSLGADAFLLFLGFGC